MDAQLRRNLGPSLAQVAEAVRERLDEGPHREAGGAHIRLRQVQQPVVRLGTPCASPHGHVASTATPGKVCRAPRHDIQSKSPSFQALGLGIAGAISSVRRRERDRPPRRKSVMKTEDSGNWMRVRSVAAGFLCVMGLPIALALADVQPAEVAAAPAVTEWVPASMHIAQAGSDVGPGADEALLVASPSSR